jgi:O-antigen/teichoic acid export membrane protein
MENIKKTVVSSLAWKLLERIGTQGIQFAVQILLARILSPENYGTIALISIFIAIANVFIQSGFSTALIQKKDTSEEDFSSVFYLSLVIAAIFYLILFITSPLIARFYNNGQLIYILRVLSLTLFLGAFNSVQNAVIAKKMQFKKLFFSSLGSIVISGIAGIICAYLGYGVWALVIQQLVNQLSVTLILWFTVDWHPKKVFSLERVKVLFSFGWKLLASALLETFYANIRSLIIGKLYTPATLGFYNRGDQFPQIIVSNINGSIQAVIFPALSSEQDNIEKIKNMVRRAIMMSSFLIFPMMTMLAVTAKPLVIVLLTEKWLPCVPFIQIFCVSYALWPIHTANLQAINALGRSDIFLKLEVIKKIFGTLILIVSIFYGIKAIAYGMLFSSIMFSFVNAYPNLKLLNYSYIEQLKDIIPSLIISLIMGFLIHLFSYLNMSNWMTLVFQTLTGIFLYLGLSKIFKVESYKYLILMFSEIRK